MLDDQDTDTIEDLCNRFAAALNNADVSALSDMVAENALILTPRAGGVKGDGIRMHFLNFAQQIRNFKLMASDLDAVSPELVREVGALSFRAVATGERVNGTYVFFWQKIDGAWKINTFFWRPGSAIDQAGGARRPSAGV